jgi:hypothetical protein
MCERGCTLCGGPCGVLGVLGRLVYWLCRDCGMQFTSDAHELTDQDDEGEE